MESIPSADGTRIAYERTGDGSPLVLVHGTSADHSRWAPVLPALNAQFTVYALDRRGRGESGDAPEYDQEREFEDVAAVVDSIAAPVVLLGHSYGGLCSLEAARRTDNVRHLVLYEPPFEVGDHQIHDPEVLEEMKAYLDAGADEQALELFLHQVARLPQPELDALRSAPNWPDRVAAAHTVYRETMAPADYEFDPALLTDLTIPTLLLTGTESPPFLRDATTALHEVLPNSRLVVLEGLGHAAMSTAPDRFVEAVQTFLEAAA